MLFIILFLLLMILIEFISNLTKTEAIYKFDYLNY